MARANRRYYTQRNPKTGIPKITFDQSATKFVLSIFGFSVDKKTGCIKDKKGKFVLGWNSTPVHIKTFIGIAKTKKGVRLVQNSIVDIIQVADIFEELGEK